MSRFSFSRLVSPQHGFAVTFVRNLPGQCRLMSSSPGSGATATQIDRIVEQIRVDNPTQHHIVAFSGGVDSSLALALTNLAFPQTTKAVIGLSAALPATQLELARKVASTVGVSLTEQQTNEGENEDVSCLCCVLLPWLYLRHRYLTRTPRTHIQYIANAGMSCYHCKTALYTALSSVLHHVDAHTTGTLTLYNGTNLDDLSDPTRVGLLAASKFNVYSPLSKLPKVEVRKLAKHLGLPNHNYAASPCLRSRLAFGVEATSDHLRKIETGKNGNVVLTATPSHHRLLTQPFSMIHYARRRYQHRGRIHPLCPFPARRD